MKVVPVWVLLLLVALVLLLCNALCTSFQQPPEKGFYLVVLVLVGFVSSVMWISAIAQELVSLLNALGLMLNISPVILGLTILAWGNSLGDFVSDVSLARQGYPQIDNIHGEEVESESLRELELIDRNHLLRTHSPLLQ